MGDMGDLSWAEISSIAREANRYAKAFQKIEDAAASAQQHQDGLARMKVQFDAVSQELTQVQASLPVAKAQLEDAQRHYTIEKSKYAAELTDLEHAKQSMVTAMEQDKTVKVEQLRKMLAGEKAMLEAEITALRASAKREKADIEINKRALIEALAMEEQVMQAKVHKIKTEFAELVKSVG